MRSEEEHVWSHSHALNEWYIAHNKQRSKKINGIAILACIVLLITYDGWLIAVHNPILQVVTRFLVASTLFVITIFLMDTYRLKQLRKHSVEYKVSKLGIHISKKWIGWSRTALPWTSLRSYTVYPVDKTGDFYVFALTTQKGRRYGLYAERNQVLHINEVLVEHNLAASKTAS